MQLNANDTQAMLRDSVRRFVEKSYKAEDSAPLGHNDTNWALFAEQGWIAAGIPEEAGGLGGDAFDLCLIAEELGRGLVREAYAPYAAVTGRLLAQIDPDGPNLSSLLWGDGRPLLAHNESPARGAPDFVQTLAVPEDEGFQLFGEKTALLGGHAATQFLVSARIEGEAGISLFVVAPDQANLITQHYRSIDNRGYANLRLAGVCVGPDALIGTRGGASDAIAQALDQGLVVACAEAVGAMDAALLMTRDYLNTRKQFGVTIGDFQALRHKLADMFIETEQARSIVLRAIAALQGDDAMERSKIAAAAKARVGRAARFVGGQAIQLHGGIGVTEEYGIGHYYKRLTAFDLTMGAGEAHLDRFTQFI